MFVVRQVIVVIFHVTNDLFHRHHHIINHHMREFSAALTKFAKDCV